MFFSIKTFDVLEVVLVNVDVFELGNVKSQLLLVFPQFVLLINNDSETG